MGETAKERGLRMWRGHEIVSYLQNRTNLVDEAQVMAEGSRTTMISGVRKKADGSEQEVSVEIRDSGPGTR